MGWVSYVEDIEGFRDRLSSNLEELDTSLKAAENPVDTAAQRELLALLSVGRKIIADLDCYLELATDPKMELAHEVVELREENSHLRGTISTLQRKNDELGRKARLFDTQEQELRECAAERDQLRKQNLSVLDRYSAPKRTRKPKPSA